MISECPFCPDPRLCFLGTLVGVAGWINTAPGESFAHCVQTRPPPLGSSAGWRRGGGGGKWGWGCGSSVLTAEEEVHEPASGEALPKLADPHRQNCKHSLVPLWPLAKMMLHRWTASGLSRNSRTVSQQCKRERVRTKFDHWILWTRWRQEAFRAGPGCCSCHHPADGTVGSEFPPLGAPAAARWPGSPLMTTKHQCWFHCLKNSVEDLKHGLKTLLYIYIFKKLVSEYLTLVNWWHHKV